jgi:hypothetical protein
MERGEESGSVELARRRLRRMTLGLIPLDVAVLGGLYFVASLPVVLAVAVLLVVGGFASVAVDRQMARIAARAAAPNPSPEPGPPIGHGRAGQMMAGIFGAYFACAVAGGFIGHAITSDATGAEVGIVGGFLTAYAVMLSVVKALKRRAKL